MRTILRDPVLWCIALMIVSSLAILTVGSAIIPQLFAGR
jgi:hypothetical protein